MVADESSWSLKRTIFLDRAQKRKHFFLSIPTWTLNWMQGMNCTHVKIVFQYFFGTFMDHWWKKNATDVIKSFYTVFRMSTQKEFKTVSSTHYVTPAMEFPVPKLSPFDSCSDTVCDLKVSINYMSLPDKQFTLVAKSFQEIRPNLTHIPFIKGVEKNL